MDIEKTIPLLSKLKTESVMFLKTNAFIVFFIVVFVSAASAFTITGSVTRVLDGDTFHLLPTSGIPQQVKVHKDGTISIRLRGIDAPEKKQSYGQEAKESLQSLVGGKVVWVEVKDIDRYGRIAGYVFLGGINVNLKQVERGFAWAYSEYLDRPYASEFYDAEKNARKHKLGLWKQVNPTPPWEWRKKNR